MGNCRPPSLATGLHNPSPLGIQWFALNWSVVKVEAYLLTVVTDKRGCAGIYAKGDHMAEGGTLWPGQKYTDILVIIIMLEIPWTGYKCSSFCDRNVITTDYQRRGYRILAFILIHTLCIMTFRVTCPIIGHYLISATFIYVSWSFNKDMNTI